MPGFVRPDAVALLVAEALGKRDLSYRTDDTHNVYFEKVAASDPNDAGGVLEHSSKNAIAWDLIDENSPLRIAYESDVLTTFLGEALSMKDVHRYADPFGAASLMLFEPGDELGWHFDRSPFAVTVMLQPSRIGGEYQYHHHLRSESDENAAGVLAALRDDAAGEDHPAQRAGDVEHVSREVLPAPRHPGVGRASPDQCGPGLFGHTG